GRIIQPIPSYFQRLFHRRNIAVTDILLPASKSVSVSGLVSPRKKQMSPLIEDVFPASARIPAVPTAELPSTSIKRPGSPFDRGPSRPHSRRIGVVLFGAIGIVGLVYVVTRLVSDLSIVHSPSVYPFLLLGVALVTALGFEFVNGFHD